MKENGRGSGAGKSRRQLNPQVAEWLAAMDGGEAGGKDAGGTDWDAWLAGLKAADRIVKVDGILVDRAVLEQRFRCVPERCSPAPERGRSRCCCADLEVHLEAIERRQIERNCTALTSYLARREPRLGLRGKGHQGCFWRDEDGLDLLSRPGGRCVFSRRDSKGRIRCHLHAFAQSEGIDRNSVQPFTCRIFPLLLVDLGRNRLVLSVLARHNYKEFASLPPQRFPCLSDRSLPPIYESLGGDLDWIFGPGFAAALARLAETPARTRPR